MSAGELHHLRDRVEHVEDKADAAVTDIRGLAKLQREHHKEDAAKFKALTDGLSELGKIVAAQGRAWNEYLGRIELKLDGAMTKASGAHHLGADAHRIASDAASRVSQIENARVEWDAQMAVAVADGEEQRLKERREWRRWVVQLVKAIGGGTILAALTFFVTKCG